MFNRKIITNYITWYWCETLEEKMSLCHTFNTPCENELKTQDPDWLGVTVDKTHDIDYYYIRSFNHIRKNYEQLERKLGSAYKREWKNYEDR